MKGKSAALILVLSVVLCTVVGSALASGYPSKPITLIVPWAPGGGTDVVARALAKPAGDYLGVQITVVNRPGGSGAVGLAEAMRAKPDGYTLAVLPVELAFLNQTGLYPFGLDAFEPVILVNSDPAGLTVRANANWKNASDFIQYAKANPGKAAIGHSGAGLLWHLAAVALEKATGAKFTLVPYDGAAPAIKALLGGEIEAVTVSVPEVASQVIPGNLKLLGVMDNQRFPMFPDVPTLKEQGFNVAITTFRGIGAPAGTPKEVVDKLHDAFKHALESDGYKELMSKLGFGIAYRNPEDYKVFFMQTAEKLGDLLSAAGLKK